MNLKAFNMLFFLKPGAVFLFVRIVAMFRGAKSCVRKKFGVKNQSRAKVVLTIIIFYFSVDFGIEAMQSAFVTFGTVR